MADFETLQLKISTDSSNAEKGLRGLSDSLKSLQKQVSAYSFGTLSSGLQQLARDAQTVSAGVGQLNKLSKAFREMADASTALAKTSDAEVAIRRITGAMNAASNIKGNFTALKDFTTSIDALRESAEKVDTTTLRRIMRIAGSVAPTPRKKKDGTEEETQPTDARQNDRSRQFASPELIRENATVINSFADSLDKVQAAIKNVDIAKLREIMQQMGIVSNQAAIGAAQEAVQGYANTTNAAQGTLRGGASAADIFRRAINGTKRDITGLARIVGGALSRPFVQFGTTLGNVKKKMDSLVTSIGRIAIYRLIRSALSNFTKSATVGLQNLAKYSAEANATLSQFSTGVLYLQNSLGAALYPVIASLVGIFNTLINVVVSALNVINMFFSALSGKGFYTRATRQTKDFSSATKGAAGSAKALKQELMGFDEINSLTPDSGGGGGGGGASLDYSNMFEKAPIDKSITDAINNADWTGLGKKISGKLRKALNSINWNSIKQKSKSITTRLTTLINGFIGDMPSDEIGTAIGNAISTAVGFVNDLWYNTNWSVLGNKIGKALMRTIDNINGAEVGRWFARKFNAAIRFLTGLSRTIEWNKVTDWLGNFIDSAIDNVSLEDAAGTICDLIVGAVASLDESLTEERLTKACNGIVAALKKIIDNLPELAGHLANIGLKFAGGMATAIVNYLNEHTFSEMVTDFNDAVGRFFGTIDVTPEFAIKGISLIIFGLSGLFGVKLLAASLKAKLFTLLSSTAGFSALGGSAAGGAATGAGLMAGLKWTISLALAFSIVSGAVNDIKGAISGQEDWAKVLTKYLFGATIAGVTFAATGSAGASLLMLKLAIDFDITRVNFAWPKKTDIRTELEEKPEQARQQFKDAQNGSGAIGAIDKVYKWLYPGTLSSSSRPSKSVKTAIEIPESTIDKLKKFCQSYSALLAQVNGDKTKAAKIIVGELFAAFDKVPNEKKVEIAVSGVAGAMLSVTSFIATLSGVKDKNVTLELKSKMSSGVVGFLEALKELATGKLKEQIGGLISAKYRPTVSKYANGGMVTAGDLFIANENGAEMVGRIGSQPAVANQEQIGDAIFRYMDAYGQSSGSSLTAEQLSSAFITAIRATGLGVVNLDGRALKQSLVLEAQRSGIPIF
nr:MAG TPA: minor tail protein [Caudoviricetes sp.]